MAISIPAIVYAQDDPLPLTETFTVTSYELDFQYPADWTVFESTSTSVIFSTPIASTGQPNASGIAMEGGSLSVWWAFEDGGTPAAEAALELANIFYEDGEDLYELSGPQAISINGRTAAQVDLESFVFFHRFIAMEIDEEKLATVFMLGSREQITTATPITFDMLATVRASGDPLPESAPVVTPALTQHHTREADQTSFSYPDGWGLEEQNNFTLLIVPNGVTIGISSDALPGYDDVVLETISSKRDGLTAGVPGVLVGDIEEIEVNGQRAARVAGLDGDIYYGFWSIDLGGNVVANISVIGEAAGVDEIQSAIQAIAESITSGLVERAALPSEGPLALTDSVTVEDGSFSLRHPAEWDALPNENTIILVSAAFSGLDSVQEDGEVVVLVQNSLEYLSSESALELPENIDVSTAARAIARAAEENGTQQAIEKLVIHDLSASLLYGAEDDIATIILIFELSDGTLASMLAIMQSDDFQNLRPTLLAIAETVENR
jgi:hypothetical protein